MRKILLMYMMIFTFIYVHPSYGSEQPPQPSINKIEAKEFKNNKVIRGTSPVLQFGVTTSLTTTPKLIVEDDPNILFTDIKIANSKQIEATIITNEQTQLGARYCTYSDSIDIPQIKCLTKPTAQSAIFEVIPSRSISIEPNSIERKIAKDIKITGTNVNFNGRNIKVKIYSSEIRNGSPTSDEIKSIEIISNNEIRIKVPGDIISNVGTRTIEVETSNKDDNSDIERVSVENALTIEETQIPVFEFIQENHENVTHYAFLPNISVTVKSPFNEIYIKTTILSSSGDTIERNSPLPLGYDGKYYHFNIGSFSGGDRVTVAVFKTTSVGSSTYDEKEVYVPAKTINVRPGAVSLRTGFSVVPFESSPVIPVSLFLRIFRGNNFLAGPIPWGLGLGVGVTPSDNPRVYQAGLSLEFFDSFDITAGLARSVRKDPNNIESGVDTGYWGISFDLRIFKSLVNAISGGSGFK